jgi:hypothetical protein
MINDHTVKRSAFIKLFLGLDIIQCTTNFPRIFSLQLAKKRSVPVRGLYYYL